MSQATADNHDAAQPAPCAVINSRTIGTGPDTLTVTLSEDAYKGNARASIALDGAPLTARPLTVTASHEAGAGETFTFKGNFGPGAHDLAISFLNDAYDGTPGTDRNLYVNKINYNGYGPNGASTATLYSAGTIHYTIPPANDPEAIPLPTVNES